MTKQDNNKLTPKEILFCKVYSKVGAETFCNGTKSYLKANPNSNPDSARVQASKLLTKNNIIDFISKQLDGLQINDSIADQELSKLILQEEEKSVKLQALKHYNELRARIEKAKQRALDNKEITTDVLIVKLPE